MICNVSKNTLVAVQSMALAGYQLKALAKLKLFNILF